MKFFNALKFGSWIEILLTFVIITGDNFWGRGDGLWFTVALIAISVYSSIHLEMKYRYDYPLNHPDQPGDERDIFGQFIVSIFGVFLAIAPIYKGEAWIQIFGIVGFISALYAVYVTWNLYLITKNHVKYVA